MVDKSSAPAYSISGIGRKSARVDTFPGPGSYNYIQKQFNTTQHPYDTFTPGPGTYQYKLLNNHTPNINFQPRFTNPTFNDIPGPGTYKPNYTTIMRMQTGYHIPRDIRNAHPKQSQLPGPGQYNLPTKLQTKTTKFGNSRVQCSGDNMPGPGAYSLNPHNKTPSYVFSKDQRSHSTSHLAPGRKYRFYAAGAYANKSIFDRLTGYSMGNRHHYQLSNDTPGPGSYQQYHQYYAVQGSIKAHLFHQANLANLESRNRLINQGPKSTRKFMAHSETKEVLPWENKKESLLYHLPSQGQEPMMSLVGKVALNTVCLNRILSARTQISQALGHTSPNQWGAMNTRILGWEVVVKEVSTTKKAIFQALIRIVLKEKIVEDGRHQRRSGLKDSRIPGPGQYNIPTTISNLPSYSRR